MKKEYIAIGISVVALIVTIVLFTQISGLQSTVASQEQQIAALQDSIADQGPDLNIEGRIAANLPIAYINIDTLNQEYLYIKQKGAELEKELRRAQNRLAQKEGKLQQDYQQLMEKYQGGFYTEQEAMEKQAALKDRQGKLMEEMQSVRQELGNLQNKLLSKMNANVSSYLDKYSKSLNYSYILAQGGGLPMVLYANDSLNITSKVLEGLNEEYQKETGGSE